MTSLPRRRQLGAAAALLFALFYWLCPGQLLAAEPVLSQPTYQVKMELNVPVPMRDGVRLSTDIYRPAAAGKFPVILIRTPYNNNTDSYVATGKFYAARGYVVAIQDCRGRYDSEGDWYPFIYEDKDGFDAVEWAGTQAWSSGKVGMLGVSYVGFTQWLAAAEGSEYLKCLFSYGSPSSIYGDTWVNKGTVYLMDAFTWAYLMDGRVNQNMAAVDWDEIVWHLPLSTMDEAAGRRLSFWKDWMQHPDYDDYWRQHSMTERFSRVNVPAVTVTAWYDDGQNGALANYLGVVKEGSEFARRNQKLIVGWWVHSGPYPQRRSYTKLGEVEFGPGALLDLETYELRWFDYWLKGIQNGIMADAPAMLYILGENRWREENEFPLARTQATKYYFHSGGRANTLFGDGRLSTAPPSDHPADSYVYDPADPVPSITRAEGGARGGVSAFPEDQRVNEQRADVLVYTSEVLAEDMEVTGFPQVELYVSSTAVDTDFCAKLVDVHPNGAAYNVSYAGASCFSTRYRDSFEQPKLMTPGEIYQISFQLNPTACLFKKGHRLRVEVTSSDFPIFNRNLNTGRDFYHSSEMIKATQTVYHDPARPSGIILPVIPR